MRNFVLLLVLVNVLAWIYQRWILEPDAPVAATHIAQDYPRLQTYRRPPPAPVAAPPALPAGEVVANVEEKEPICIKVGPISDETEAERLASRLRERGLELAMTSGEGPIWVGHWVQVVDFKDRDAAEVAREALVRAGLRDAYIVPGADEPKLSLGVFRSADSAASTIRQARALGYTTRMDERYQPGTQYWLTVAMPDGRGFRAGELRSAGGQILRTEAVSCPAG